MWMIIIFPSALQYFLSLISQLIILISDWSDNKIDLLLVRYYFLLKDEHIIPAKNEVINTISFCIKPILISDWSHNNSISCFHNSTPFIIILILYSSHIISPFNSSPACFPWDYTISDL